MDRLLAPGRIIFALGIIALGVLQFFAGDYVAGRPPAIAWPSWMATLPGKVVWAYISGGLFIIFGIAIILNKKADLVAILIGVMIFTFSFLLRHLTQMNDWINSYKSLALGGGALIVAASFIKRENTSSGYSNTKSGFVLTGCILLSLFLIVCGIAHFKFEQFISEKFIPAYIPFRLFWTYLTAVALITGGIGLIFNQTRKWAAALSGLMILLWFILLHIPRTFEAPRDYSEWMGVFESFSFSGIFFVLAAMLAKKDRL